MQGRLITYDRTLARPVECLPMGNQLHDTSVDPEPIIADPRPRLAERTAERDEQGDAPVREVVAQVPDERDPSGRVEPV